MKDLKTGVLFLIFLGSGLAWSLPIHASLTCKSLLHHPVVRFTQLHKIAYGNKSITIVATEQSLEVRIPKNLQIDESLNPVIWAILGLHRAQVTEDGDHHIASLRLEMSEAAFQEQMSLLSDHVVEILSMSQIDQAEPPSFSESSSFDHPSRLERFHENVAQNLTPVRFRERYKKTYHSAFENLPAVLRVALKTEFYLDDMGLPDSLAVKVVRLSYGLDISRAHQVLEEVKKQFVNSLVLDEPMNVNLTAFLSSLSVRKKPLDQDVARLTEDHARLNPNLVSDGYLFNDSDYVDPRETQLGGVKVNPEKVMIDDIYPELIDASLMSKLEEDGVTNLLDFVYTYNGVMLMYDLGLTRDEIRDLYYHVRSTYGVRLRIGEEFGLTLRIFRDF